MRYFLLFSGGILAETGTDTRAEAEHRSVSVAEPSEEFSDSGSTRSAEDADADILDLTPELEGAPEPGKDDDASPVLHSSPKFEKEGASLTEAEDAGFTVEPIAASWMKPKNFMNLLAKARK